MWRFLLASAPNPFANLVLGNGRSLISCELNIFKNNKNIELVTDKSNERTLIYLKSLSCPADVLCRYDLRYSLSVSTPRFLSSLIAWISKYLKTCTLPLEQSWNQKSRFITILILQKTLYVIVNELNRLYANILHLLVDKITDFHQDSGQRPNSWIVIQRAMLLFYLHSNPYGSIARMIFLK